MLNEVMLAQLSETMQRLSLSWIEFEAELHAGTEPEAGRCGVRHGVAATLVRLGGMLDCRAGESLGTPPHSPMNHEARHAL